MMGSSAMKTGDHSDATGHKHGISKTLKDKFHEAGPGIGETKEEVQKANALEDKNNDAAAKKEYADMMKAKKASPLEHRGHGKGKRHSHGKRGDGIAKNIIHRANATDPLSQRPNAKKTAKKAVKSEEKKLKASEANASLQRKYEANMDSGKEFKELSGKDRRETKSLGRKANRANKKANVAESVRKYEAHKVADYMEKPKKEKTGGILDKRGRNKYKDGIAVPNKTRKIFGDKQLKKSQGSGRKKESKEDKEARKKDLKTYRQNKGLRGAINARRTGKGKDKI